MYLVSLVQTDLHPLPRECLIFSLATQHTLPDSVRSEAILVGTGSMAGPDV